jgi:hypothetical protein
MGKKSGSGSGIWVWDEQPGSYFRELKTIFCVKILKFFDADPGWKKFGSGMEKIRIRDKHPGSATLVQRKNNFLLSSHSERSDCGEM